MHLYVLYSSDSEVYVYAGTRYTVIPHSGILPILALEIGGMPESDITLKRPKMRNTDIAVLSTYMYDTYSMYCYTLFKKDCVKIILLVDPGPNRSRPERGVRL